MNQVQKAEIPVFGPSDIIRYRATFSGRVQKVGFRMEVMELAKRLDLTGFCQNLENGDVLAEIQGQENRIQYLIEFMESLKRIKIKDKVIEQLSIIENEVDFVKRK